MPDVKKTVEIALNIIGSDVKTLSKVSDAFDKIFQLVTKTKNEVTNFQKTLNTLKVPTGLENIAKAIEPIGKIKFGNLDNVAKGLKKLGDMKAPPNLTAFATEIKKLADIKKLPGLFSLANGLDKIAKTSFVGFSNKVRIIERNLRRLASINLDNLATVLKGLNAINLSKAADQLKKLEKAVKDTGDQAGRSGLKIRTFGDKVKTVFQFRLISAGILALSDSIRSGVDAIIEYDQALKDLQAITGATSIEVAQMGIKILEVASTTKFSATEVAEGMRIIAQAGFSASESVQTMQAVSDLATGTLSSMATTVDLVTTAMRVFRIDSSRASEVSDVFANAVNRSKLTIDKLRTAMNFVGPIARDSGVSFKELAASMGTLANSGLRASTIGTGLRRIFAELVDPSKKLKDAIKDSGVVISELDPRANSLSSVLSNLGIVMQDTTVAFDVFGKRGAAAILSLVNSGDGFDSMLATIGQSGTAARQAAIQMEGLGVSFKNMKDKAGILAIAIGNTGVSKAMKILVDTIRSVIDVLIYMTDSVFGKVIFILGLLTAAVYAFSVALKTLAAPTFLAGLGTIAITVAAAFETLTFAVAGTATALTMTGVGAAILAIVGTISALVWWIGKASKEAEQIAILADNYQALSKSLKDYKIDIAGVSETSKEFEDANKSLRKSLIKTADTYEDVSSEALLAAVSINSLTGKIEDGGVAINAYSKKLEAVAKGKLIDAANSANKAFARIKIPFDLIERYDSSVEQLGSKFERLQKYVSELDLKNGKLSSSEKKLRDDFLSLNETSIKLLENMRSLGKVNFNTTVENFRGLARAEGYTGDILDAIVSQFKSIQENANKVPKNLIEKWAVDGTDALSNLFDEYENINKEFGTGKGVFGEDAKGVSEKELIIKAEAAKKSLKIKLDSLNKETAQLIANGKNEEVIARRHQDRLNVLNKEAEELRIALSKNVAYQNLVILNKERIEKEKIIAKAREDYKNDALERVKIIDKANADYAKSRERLREGTPVDYDEQEKQHKEYLNNLKVAHEKHILDIALAEAKGIITTEQATADKSAAQLDYYKSIKVEAEKYLKLLDGLEEEGSELYVKRLEEFKKAEANEYKQRSDNLVKFNKIVADSKEELIKLDDDYANELKKNSQRLKEIKEKSAKDLEKIEKEYSSASLKIAEDLNNAKIKLDESILNNKKKNIQDEYDLTSNSEDLIRKIKEKSLSEEEKQQSQQLAALKKLSEGRVLVNKFYFEGDKENLVNGKALLKQALGMVDVFSNQKKAIKLVKDATKELRKVSGFEKQIADQEALTKMKEEEAKAEKKRIEAKSEYDNKVKNATTAINEIRVKEDQRHKEEMTNLLKELNIYKLKVKEAEHLIRLAGGTVSARPESSLINNEISELEILRKKIPLLKSIKEIKESTTKSDQISMTLDENGIKVFTNLVGEAGNSFIDLKEKGKTSLSDMKTSAKNIFDDIWKEYDEKGTATFSNIEATSKQSLENIEKVGNSLELFKTSVDDFTKIESLKDELNILASMNKVFDIIANVTGYNDVVSLKDAIDSLKDKTITITKKYVTKGVESVRELATGGRIPGFGGGDRNPILAEDGEWIINKYAVRKFGDDFMASINNMTLPKFAIGGKVGVPLSTTITNSGSSETLIVRFQAGDLEAPVKITDSSSRKSIKNMAKELTKMRLAFAR